MKFLTRLVLTADLGAQEHFVGLVGGTWSLELQAFLQQLVNCPPACSTNCTNAGIMAEVLS